jgi:MFS family permease
VAGSAVSLVVLPAIVYQQTKSSFATSVLTMGGSLPYVIFGLLAGAQVDRWNRRRTMVFSDMVRAALMISIPFWGIFGAPPWWQIVAVAWLAGSVGVWYDAANFGALPVLVSPDRLMEANNLAWSASTAAQIGMPALAGVFLATIGAAPSVTIDAASFAAAAVLVLGIRRPLNLARDNEGRNWRDLVVDARHGLRFVFAEPSIRLYTLLSASNSISSGALAGLLVVYAGSRFHIGAHNWRLGLFFTACAVGALIATLSLTQLSKRFGQKPLVLVCLFLCAGFQALLAVASFWWLSLILLAICEATTMDIIVVGITVRQSVAPEGMQGRVNLVGRMVAFGLAQPLGALAGGWLAEYISVGTVLAIMAAPMLLSALWGGFVSKVPATAEARS